MTLRVNLTICVAVDDIAGKVDAKKRSTVHESRGVPRIRSLLAKSETLNAS